METVGIGAEALIYKEGSVLVKKRLKKGYRLDEIDKKLRRSRTKKEAKLLNEARRSLVAVPLVYSVDLNKKQVEMELIEGKLIKDYLEKTTKKRRIWICEQIGSQVSRLHQANIIHGDLTTSNMILRKGKIFLIDFGLAERSDRIEDKATDVHLFMRALISKHSRFWRYCFDAFKEGYKNKDAKAVFDRLSKIEKRGRYSKRAL